MVHDDIAMLLYQSGFGNEHLALDTKCKAVQCILFNQVFKSRHDQIEDLMAGLNSLGILDLLRTNESCTALVFPLQSEVQNSESDVLGLLDYEDDLSVQEEQAKLWFEEYIKLLARGNLNDFALLLILFKKLTLLISVKNSEDWWLEIAAPCTPHSLTDKCISLFSSPPTQYLPSPLFHSPGK